MKRKHNQELINDRCSKLEAQGLEIWHEDSSVCCSVGGEDVLIDFSASPEDRWIMTAIQQAYRLGIDKGKNEIQTSLRSLLHME